MSLADLCLLLLGFMVILYTGKADVRDIARATRESFESEEEGDNASHALVVDAPADTFFLPDEAVLTRHGRARFIGVGRRAAALGFKVRIESVGRSEGSSRLDGFELSAARAAAVARAVGEGGLPSGRIEISMPPDRRRPPPPPGQQLTVRTDR